MPTELNKELENYFSYHAPTQEQIEIYQHLRQEAKAFAYTLLALVPPGPDRTVAIRKLREVVMVANQAIACNS